MVVGGAGRRGVVAAASYEARRYGIGSAMPMGQARAACPHLVIVSPDHAFYGEVSAQVFEIFRSFTPRVEGLSLDEAYLDIGGLWRHYDSPVAVGKTLRETMRRVLALPVSVGIATNKMLAKLASEAAKPDGLRHVHGEDSIAFLHPLWVRAIPGIGEATHAALEGLGVATMGELAEIPVATLIRRLGVAAGRQLADLAQGKDPRPVEAEHPTKSISVSETYEYDLTTPEQVDTELLRLCERLGSRLHLGPHGTTVTLTVRFADFETQSRQERQPEVMRGAHDLWGATATLRSRFDWSRPVRLLGIGVSQMQAVGTPTQLSTGSDPRWTDLTEAVADVRDRFGSAAVGPARLAQSDGKTGKTDS